MAGGLCSYHLEEGAHLASPYLEIFGQNADGLGGSLIGNPALQDTLALQEWKLVLGAVCS